jgi:phage baseplate assembly protein gpV
MNLVGIVSSVDAANKSVRVTHPDLDGRVSPPLPVLDHVWNFAEPAVGDYVLCAYVSGDCRQGFCIGGYGGAG